MGLSAGGRDGGSVHGIGLILVRDAQADADQVTLFLCLDNQPFGFRLSHSSKRRDQAHWSGYGWRFTSRNFGVMFGSRAFLQWQSDQVAEAAFGMVS
jgi:hypothetical protein